MDYRQKYIKYKSKYFELKQIAGGDKDAIAKLEGIEIPPELQALNNAFFPGFNIDSQYVDKLLKYTRKAMLKKNLPTDEDRVRSIMLELYNLNNATYGLCEIGDRNNNKHVSHTVIKKLLTDQPSKNHLDAFAFFRTVDKIRNLPLKDIKASKDAQIKKFNAFT